MNGIDKEIQTNQAENEEDFFSYNSRVWLRCIILSRVQKKPIVIIVHMLLELIGNINITCTMMIGKKVNGNGLDAQYVQFRRNLKFDGNNNTYKREEA